MPNNSSFSKTENVIIKKSNTYKLHLLSSSIKIGVLAARVYFLGLVTTEEIQMTWQLTGI
jgi:hypothetical protein